MKKIIAMLTLLALCLSPVAGFAAEDRVVAGDILIGVIKSRM